MIFRCASVVGLNLGTGRQRQKFIRLLSIRHRFEVLTEVLAAVDTHCDDYVYPGDPLVSRCRTRKFHPRCLKLPCLALVSNDFRLA